MSATRIYRRLLGYLRPYLFPRFALAVVCMLVYSGSNAIMPLLVQRIFDDVFSQKNMAMLALLPVAIVIVFTLRGLASYGNTYWTEWVGQRIVTDLRDGLNARVQALPLSFFNRTPSATIVARVTNDVTQVRESLTQATVSLLRDSTSLVALIGAAVWLDPVLAGIALLAFPLSVLPVLGLSKRLRGYSKRGQEALGDVAALLQETIQGNRIVKAFGMEDYEKRRFNAESRRLFRLHMKASRARAAVQPIMELLAAFGVAAVVWYGGYSVIHGLRSQGAFFGFLTALLLVYEPFKGLARANGQIQQGLASAERIFEILDEPSDVLEKAGARALEPLRDELRFEAVHFRYPPRTLARGTIASPGASDELALRGIDLTLRRGEVVALVGASGAGKSTLADLIPRFYDPTQGRIAIDGIDLRDVTLASLRAQIAIVAQHTFLFNDTVRANIAYGSHTRPYEDIVAAARAAHAHEFVVDLPQGYDTVVGELGMTLSGGQRQRIAIARALLKNAPILLLDEATSALDSESERLVQEAIDRLMVGRTTLVIAHRLATVQRADRIVVLAGGAIVEQGTHAELLARAGAYRRLHDQQRLVGPTGDVAESACG